MTVSVVSLRKSTTVRIDRLMTTVVKTAFGVLERALPDLGAWWAERLWFTVPDAGARVPARRQPAGFEPGRRVEIGLHGRKIVGETWGEGPLVYLIHGWGGRRTDLAAYVGPLTAAGYRVLAFDGPSHGQSDPGPSGRKQTTLVEIRDAILAVDAAEGPAFAVVAHSGGAMATGLALLDGLSPQRLVFVAPMSGVAGYIRGFARHAGFGERITSRMVTRIERRVQAPLSAFDLPDLVRRITPAPLLVVHDRRDAEIPYAESERLVAGWPDAEMFTTESLGHRRILRAPHVVAAAVDFIDAASSSAGPAYAGALGGRRADRDRVLDQRDERIEA